jgi:hypothetical protein
VCFTACKGCDGNPEVDLDRCLGRDCDRLVHAERTKEITLLSASEPLVHVSLTAFPVGGSESGQGGILCVTAVHLSGQPLHLYFDREELAGFLRGEDLCPAGRGGTGDLAAKGFPGRATPITH